MAFVQNGLNDLGGLGGSSAGSSVADFADLFADLEGNQPDVVDVENDQEQEAMIDRQSAIFRRVWNGSLDDDKRLGRMRCKVRVVGDPEIVDAKGNYYHYLGPALVVVLDARGVVRTLEFIGVEGGMKDSNYIRDVWQYDVRSQKYKYKDLRDSQGTPAHRMRCKDAEAYYGTSWVPHDGPEFSCGDTSWDSEVAPNAKPPVSFLQKFQPKSETFFINGRTHTFARGPPFGVLKAVIENPARCIKALISSLSKDTGVWMQQAASAITHHQKTISAQKRGKVPMPVEKTQMVQVAQLVFGLTACVACGDTKLDKDAK
eukprot:TRINITY_DN29089_c0_g1_i2.p1 TRINITY_DN29089_c0_g1~~TRINITY_DN29089_c0_g1_i2.p1  ORF type:complete len:316 (-),score=29.74 TRINITY_DN29089_c0_g1_i2:91-1038(-)